jgi:outer membrane protein TolC
MSMQPFARYRKSILWMVLLPIVSSTATAQDTVSFQTAIELALSHSSEMDLSHADEIRAYETYLEARNTYVPKIAIGSDVGYAYGFPLSLEGSAPTLFNVTTQFSVWSASQQSFLHAAKTEWNASKSETRHQRSQVVADTALTYIDLARWESKLAILRAELAVAENVETAVAERVKEGVDKGIDRTKAELVEAQVQMSLTEAEGSIDLLRTRLSQLTALPALSIHTERDSIPAFQSPPNQADPGSQAVRSSPAIESAQESAAAKQLRAKGEHRAFYPTADFAAQYGYVNTSLTNFEQFFVPHSFQPNNVTFGLVLRLPFLDSSQRARAAAADAEATRARKEVEIAKSKTAMDALRLQHNLEQLLAAVRVADLRYRLAQNELDAARVRTEAQTGNYREQQDATVAAAERTLERINSEFEVQRAEVQLLLNLGELESWAIPVVDQKNRSQN